MYGGFAITVLSALSPLAANARVPPKKNASEERVSIASAPLGVTTCVLVLQELSQRVLENPAMAVVVQLGRRVDPAGDRELFHLAVVTCRPHGEILSQLEARRDPANIELLEAREAERLEIFVGLELQRNDAHADQVASMNALIALCDGCFDTEKPRSFRRPVAR